MALSMTTATARGRSWDQSWEGSESSGSQVKECEWQDDYYPFLEKKVYI